VLFGKTHNPPEYRARRHAARRHLVQTSLNLPDRESR
jgi:hypothetical protein